MRKRKRRNALAVEQRSLSYFEQAGG